MYNQGIDKLFKGENGNMADNFDKIKGSSRVAMTV